MRLTVVQTLPALDSGGVERGTLEVAAELVRRGHRSIVISAGGRLVEQLVREGSEHVVLPIGHKSLLTIRHAGAVRHILQKEHATILHTRSRLPAWVSWLAWRSMDKNNRPAFITTVHGLYSVNPYSAIMTKGDKVIAVSECVRDYILENYKDVDKDRIEIIHRGVDPEVYNSDFSPSPQWLDDWQRHYPELKGKFTVVLPARLTRLKGHEDFIRIIKAVADSGVPVHGVIAGGAHPRKRHYLREIESNADRLGIRDRIIFLGHRDDLREVMAVSDVVMSLSGKPESFGRTVLESLSLGTPVIAYDHGGVSEILRETFPEGLVQVHDVDGAASKLIAFYRNRPTVLRENPFTLSALLDKTIALYECVAQNRQGT